MEMFERLSGIFLDVCRYYRRTVTLEETDQLYQISYVVYRPTKSDKSCLQLI